MVTSNRYWLVRYGAVPSVSRARWQVSSDAAAGPLAEPYRDACVVVQTPFGEQLGTVLEAVRATPGDQATEPLEIVRLANDDDLEWAESAAAECEAAFDEWNARIAQWRLKLELIDLERLRDSGRYVLYVLTDRGSDTTMLALQAAAAGLGEVHVQPVTADGVVTLSSGSGGGCGTGGCGCQH